MVMKNNVVSIGAVQSCGVKLSDLDITRIVKVCAESGEHRGMYVRWSFDVYVDHGPGILVQYTLGFASSAYESGDVCVVSAEVAMPTRVMLMDLNAQKRWLSGNCYAAITLLDTKFAVEEKAAGVNQTLVLLPVHGWR
jgi:hypothetical protein